MLVQAPPREAFLAELTYCCMPNCTSVARQGIWTQNDSWSSSRVSTVSHNSYTAIELDADVGCRIQLYSPSESFKLIAYDTCTSQQLAHVRHPARASQSCNNL